MEGITPMEGVIFGDDAYVTQSTGHSATIPIDANECKNADFAYSTGHGAFSNSNVNECNEADFTHSTGHSAFSDIEPMDVDEDENEDSTSTSHSATIGNIDAQGIDPMDGLEASFENREITTKKSTKFQAYIPSTWPIKQNMYVGMNTTPGRYVENLHLLGSAWVQKVQHVARLTLNTPTGPVWPTEIEPHALALFAFLKTVPRPGYIRRRADFADEIDFVWRENPPWLPPTHQAIIPLWEYVTGMARTWGWNWHNEARKQGAPEDVWRKEDRRPRTRNEQNKSSKAAHHHILVSQNIAPVAAFIRTNKFYRVGDDMTACERPESSPRCRYRCHHTADAHTLRRLKVKHGLIRAPGVEPENEYGGIE